jgi:Domain of unknown function (DUF4352)
MGRTVVLLGLAILAVLALTWVGCVRHDRIAARGEELRYDDFAFSVQDVRQAKTLGPAGKEATAKGTFWIVDVRVANEAKRVGYKLRSHQLAVVDEDDDRIDRSSEGEAALAAEGGATSRVDEIGHGESCVTRAVFDVPESVKEPRLKIRFGDVGTLVDDVLLGDWSLSLR